MDATEGLKRGDEVVNTKAPIKVGRARNFRKNYKRKNQLTKEVK